MLFNSVDFLIFGCIFFILWPIVRKYLKLKWILIVIASYIFYGWWDWRFLFLITASGSIDFFSAKGMKRFPAKKRLFLVLSVIGNIGSLATFKYLAFFIESINSIAGFSGLTARIPVVQLALPIGISFYTFQSMSYTIDVYREKLKPVKNLFHYFAYLSMFPQLVAGPIIRASDLLPQLEKNRVISNEDKWEGLRLIVYGYFKKVVIADNLAPAINLAFGTRLQIDSTPFWWLIVTMFAFQIYYDFSGYSDIARGLARWMGFDFKLNFNHPYIASGIRDFWRRWHISLSTWFSDYVFYPIFQKRVTELSYFKSMWITMLISGLWHGAAWHFIVWGGLHALYLSVEQITGWAKKIRRIKGGKYIATFLVIVQVWIAWVFFRAESLPQAFSILKSRFSFSDFSMPIWESINIFVIFVLVIGITRELSHLFSWEKHDLKLRPVFQVLQPVVISLMITACVFFRGPGSEFIYFQF